MHTPLLRHLKSESQSEVEVSRVSLKLRTYDENGAAHIGYCSCRARWDGSNAVRRWVGGEAGWWSWWRLWFWW